MLKYWIIWFYYILFRLARKFKNEDILITFDCQDESDDLDGQGFGDEEDPGEEQDEDQEEDEDDDMTYGINFTVSIKKAGKEMVFDCSAGDTISIQNIKISSESNNSTEATYDGPPFENLSDSLQEAFVQYLEERKINSDLSEFILSYSQAKEQKEYVHWLKTFAQFTEAK